MTREPTTDTPPPTTVLDRSPLALAGELAVATVVSAAAAWLGYRLVETLAIPRPSFVPDAFTALSAAVVTIGLVGAVVRPGWSRWRSVAAWGLLALLPTLSLSLLLHGTRFYLNGLSGDQSFRTQYLNRLISSPALADMTYIDTPGYYPPAWFWVAGRIADLLGIPGWWAYKPLAVITMGVAGALAFTVWSTVVGRRTAVVLSLAGVLVGLATAAYEPYSWVLAVLIPPLACIAWRTLRAAANGEVRAWNGASAVLGVFLGITATVYTLLTFYFAFLGVLTAAAAVAAGGGDVGARLRRTSAAVAVVGLTALPIAAITWTPFVLEGVLNGFGSGAAQDYLPIEGARFPVPMAELTLSGAACAVGLAWIVLCARRNRVAGGLALVGGSVYLWYALSMAALALGTTLLPVRLEPVLLCALHAGAVLAVVDGLAWSRRRMPGLDRTALVAGAVAAALLFTVSIAQDVREHYDELVVAAFTEYDPTGVRASGPAFTADEGAWNADLATTIADMTGRPPESLVVLTSYYPLLAHAPYWGFQVAVDQYANPMADFSGRRAEVLDWAAATGPDDLLARLERSPYMPPSVFVFDRRSDGLHVALTENLFPRMPETATIDARFPAELFDDPAFDRRDVGPFTVIVRR